MSGPLYQAFWEVFASPQVWLVVAAAACYGVFIGSVPGLTATMAVALFVPMTFWLDPVTALAAIVTMSACSIFAGDIPAILLRIPGTPASAAYADETYRLSQAGLAERMLGTSLVCSCLGGLLGAAALILLGQQLARFAAMFSVAEYFWLYVLGLTCAVLVSQGSPLKALLALIIGLLLSTVGLSAVHTQARFTLGRPELYQGVSFIPAMIGLFGLSEVLKNLLQLDGAATLQESPPTAAAPARLRWLTESLRNVGHVMRTVASRKLALLRSGAIGATIGMLPGAGADIAAWVSYGVSKRGQKPSPTGAPEDLAVAGLSDATAANNAALSGAWIPALVFGIPGDSITAIVIGVLLMKNVRPGPDVFVEQSVLVYSIYLTFILANLVLLPVGLVAIRMGTSIVRIPRRVLLPIILLFCVVGAYALNGSAFDIVVMLVMGLFGFFLERRQVPVGPVVLGIILGGPLEERLIQTMTGANGSLVGLVNRPLAATLALLCAALWISMMVLMTRRNRQNRTENS